MKNPSNLTKDMERKTEIGGKKKDLFEKGLRQNKVLCSSSMELNCQPYKLSSAPHAKETDLRLLAGFWL